MCRSDKQQFECWTQCQISPTVGDEAKVHVIVEIIKLHYLLTVRVKLALTARTIIECLMTVEVTVDAE